MEKGIKSKSIGRICALVVITMFLVMALSPPVPAGTSTDSWLMEGNSNADSNDYLGTDNIWPLRFCTNSGERMRITSDGKVGIGTTNPQTTLHIVTDGDYHLRLQRYDEVPYMDFISGGAYCAIDCVNTWDELFQIRDDGVPVFHIENYNGFTGIGTTAPQHRLHVVANYINSVTAIYGESPYRSGRGIHGQTTGDYSEGVYGWASGYYSTGVYGRGEKYGIYGTVPTGTTNYAGYFNGRVHITGTLSKGGGSFKIDHPLDPENKYLYHSFVESPDMMNVYNGNIVLDDNGEGWVELPEWFETLNRDFRYQLTPIGAPGPNLHIAEEVSDNRFKIAGGEPGMEVSWQVTGIRQDPWAEKYRIPVEEAKPEQERGKYLHPELYGMPENMAVGYIGFDGDNP